MKFNFVAPIICAILLGYLCASFIFNQYGVEAFSWPNSSNIYFLQTGSYNTEEASQKSADNTITVFKDDKYYSYIGMTADLDIAKRIQKMYQEKGVEVYINEDYMDNSDFLNQLIQYDILLDSSKNTDEVNSVLKTVLATYDEIILNR